mmetsp:Transcript_16716/g.36340  ORF Transcript_16716/g.36340 Transcript_16716/m.36340 type:complete len:224 (+) Transcript_16716:350-1021(+)
MKGSPRESLISRNGAPVCASQTVAIPSLVPVKSRLPSWLRAREMTSLMPEKIDCFFPSGRDHSIAELSCDPVTSVVESGWKVDDTTQSECPLSFFISFFEGTSQSLLPSAPAEVKIRVPSLLKAVESSGASWSGKVQMDVPDSMSHNLAYLSFEPDMICRSLAPNLAETTQPLCSSSFLSKTSCAVAAKLVFQTPMDLSAEAVRSLSPDESKATSKTTPLCPL